MVSKSDGLVEIVRTYSVACDIQDEDGGGERMPDRACGTNVRVSSQAIPPLIRDVPVTPGHGCPIGVPIQTELEGLRGLSVELYFSESCSVWAA